ncbi:MAG: substrate-binding domain-containing protein [Christensenella sp.]|uniref:substrate-binding domain-containing protein n=1 Tax=Christensenella sp. TaxID=1935934 RepID=UPI002B217888|nr:substrate-binding domain-containing protein [Christensenella sp.]MEA5004246.1 substrate-binding domain-containing protein [Christensenella sp.]
MKSKVTVIVCLVLVALFVFAACGTPAPAVSESKAPETTSEAPSDGGGSDDGGEASGEPVNIVFIPKNQGNPYFESIVLGFQRTAEKLGADKVKFETTGPATADATSQIEYVEAAVQNGADVIFIAANSNDALNGTFDDARAAGTKIVIINQDIPGSEDHRDAAIMPVDFTKTGTVLLNTLGDMIDFKGDFAILSATTDAPDQNTWIDDMKNLLASDEKYKDMNLVEVVYGDDQPEKSTTEMEALLAKYPDLKGVIAPTTVGVAAAAKVIQTKGVADKVKLTGLGLPSEMAEFVLDGTVEKFALWNPPMEGDIGVYMALALKDGSLTIEPGATFEAGEYGTFTFTDNGQIISLAEPMIYDKSNIEEFAAQF